MKSTAVSQKRTSLLDCLNAKLMHNLFLAVICSLALIVASCGSDSSTGPEDNGGNNGNGGNGGNNGGSITFDSGSIAPGASYSYTFGEEGAVDYICTFHPNMTGSVTVESGADISGDFTVTITEGQQFDPSDITIAPETEVTWVNEDDIAHTATSQSGSSSNGNNSGDNGRY